MEQIKGQIALFDQPEMAAEITERVHESATGYRVPVYVLQLIKDKPLKVEGDKKPGNISNPRQAADILMEATRYQHKEVFGILMLTTKNSLIGYTVISIGSLNASIVHPREIYLPAIKACASSIILSHNHPSGDPSPSQEDLEVTRRLVDAGNIIGIHVRDHVIIGDGCFFSFKEKGLL